MFDTTSAAVTTASDADLTKSQQSQKKLAEDLDHFLNLLVTQLKNQDPLDPMDANEFTQQLVQFAGVEQQIQVNANLEEMLRQQEYSHLGALVSFIDKSVEAKGDRVMLEEGNAEFAYELMGNAESATLTIRDGSGQVVYFAEADNSAGKHEFTWDGKDNFGFQQEDGLYTINVSATGSDGDPIEVQHTVTGRITGVRMDNGDAILEMGGVYQVDLDNVVKVKD